MLTRNAHLALLLLGILMNIIGPTLPFVIADYEISLLTAGTVFTLMSVGRLIAVLFGGSISDIYGRKPLIVFGSMLLSLSLAGYGLAKTWLSHLFFIFTTGLSYGLLDIAVNALIADLYPENRGFALNRLHAFFGIGSCLGSLIAGIYLSMSTNWRALFFIIAACALLYCISSFCLIYPQADSSTSRKLDPSVVRAIGGNIAFWLLAITMFAYTGVGHGIVGWLNQYLSATFTFTPLAASLVLSLYNLGLSAGRLTCSRLSSSLGYRGTILLCTGGAAVFLGMAVFGQALPLITIGFMLTGFFLAGLFPTAIAMGSDLFPQSIGTVSGLLITSASLGGMVIPAGIGAISDHAGMVKGMGTTCVILVLVFAISLKLPRSKKAGHRPPADLKG
ncbi:MAG: MFS transporter, partial [Limnochordia bacterium]|nr:MFS transporter [Limnochordia bacterium]